jgi:hypothetical protein
VVWFQPVQRCYEFIRCLASIQVLFRPEMDRRWSYVGLGGNETTIVPSGAMVRSNVFHKVD